jgi:hypothetical protein
MEQEGRQWNRTIDEDKFENMYNEYHQKCVLYNFCKYDGDDPNWSIADLVELVREDNDI